jgi:hypothetical protein
MALSPGLIAGVAPEAVMPDYEIHVLRDDRYSAAMICEQCLTDDEAAIAAALRLARGAAFEVWRDLDCVYGLASGRAQLSVG